MHKRYPTPARQATVSRRNTHPPAKRERGRRARIAIGWQARRPADSPILKKRGLTCKTFNFIWQVDWLKFMSLRGLVSCGAAIHSRAAPEAAIPIGRRGIFGVSGVGSACPQDGIRPLMAENPTRRWSKLAPASHRSRRSRSRMSPRCRQPTAPFGPEGDRHRRSSVDKADLIEGCAPI